MFENEINFEYIQDYGFVYPAEITYGPNEILFYNKERSDSTITYLKGSRIKQRFILDKIKISYNGNLIREYDFKYYFNGSSYDRYSLLNEVIEYGIDGERNEVSGLYWQTLISCYGIS